MSDHGGRSPSARADRHGRAGSSEILPHLSSAPAARPSRRSQPGAAVPHWPRARHQRLASDKQADIDDFAARACDFGQVGQPPLRAGGAVDADEGKTAIGGLPYTAGAWPFRATRVTACRGLPGAPGRHGIAAGSTIAIAPAMSTVLH